MIPKDEVRLESELNSKELSASEGQAFLETVLEELATCGRDSALYRQCVDTTDEFEPLFVHHALLRAAEYNIVDLATYVQHTEQLAQTGIIESLYAIEGHHVVPIAGHHVPVLLPDDEWLRIGLDVALQRYRIPIATAQVSQVANESGKGLDVAVDY